MAIINTAVTTTASSIYTSSGSSAIVTVHLCNYSGATQVANLFVVPSGLTANVLTMVYSNLSIPPTNTYIINTEKFILSNGDGIFASCGNAGAVSATVSYIGV
mgnify:FL=1